MKNLFVFLFAFLLPCSFVQSQQVGLVLSGGGARGIAHIGIIQALEENHVPIDYITGTSMGAIVGGLYAMGLTPAEMIKLLKSEDFTRWSTGELEQEYMYYYRNADPKPKLVELPVKINRADSIKFKPSFLPTNIVPPHQMNFAFLPMFAQTNALADGDFLNLFVPFRCVASDIYKKEAVVLRCGDLGDAVRASMTFPFMFKPIVIDGQLLFDGGIFNNFPVDVMREDFKPGFMIGSVVSDNPPQPGEQDIIPQIENMIMSRTNYNIPESEGLVLRFSRSGVNTFDFGKVDELVKAGYDSTIAHMNEIKARVTRQVTLDEVSKRRVAFRKKFPELRFRDVYVLGVDTLQKSYVKNAFGVDNKIFNIEELKSSYFKLISDEKISEVVPKATYNRSSGLFDLHLNVRTQEQLKILLGGNVSSSTSNEAYFGMVYQSLGEYSKTYHVDGQFGRMYNGLGFGSRMEMPGKKNWYVKMGIVLHNFDYYSGSRLFYDDKRTADFNQNEVYGKLSVGFPLKTNGRYEFGVGYGLLSDIYKQPNYSYESDDVDKTISSLGSLFGRFEVNTLNHLMFPTRGMNYSGLVQLMGGEELFRPSDKYLQRDSERSDLWLQARFQMDNYHRINSKIALGAFAELCYSSKELLSNYTANSVQASVFQPTPHSKSVFNESFSANSYAVLGVKPIYQISKQLHLRNESYVFLPHKAFMQLENNKVGYHKAFSKAHFMNETTLVFDFKIAAAGAYMNYYSSAASKWNFGVNIGFLLFNPKFKD